jgi:hypothetical protein
MKKGGGRAKKIKNLSRLNLQQRGGIAFVISTSWSLSGWLWHLTVAGCRACTGQFPNATLHD